MKALRELMVPSGRVPANVAAAKVELDRRPRVLCATDLRPRSKMAVRRAQAITEALGGQLLLLHVLSTDESTRTVRRRSARARAVLDDHARKLARPGSDPQVAVRAGAPHATIADVAIEWDADLIVLGPYRRRFGDGLRGATAERVIRKAGRPVLVVNRRASGPYEHVLLTSDLSSMATGIAAAAKDLGFLEAPRVSVIHALQHTSAILHMAGVSESERDRYRRSLRLLASDEIRTHLADAGLNSEDFSVFSLETSPFKGIEQIVERTGSDLVVIGSSRFPLLKRVFIGSVSNEVLRGIQHDVLLISPAAVQRVTSMLSRRQSQDAESVEIPRAHVSSRGQEMWTTDRSRISSPEAGVY